MPCARGPAAWSRRCGICASSAAESKNVAALIQYAEVRPLRRRRARRRRASRPPRSRFSILCSSEFARGRSLVRDQIRQPRVDRRPEEAGREAGNGRERDDRRRAAANGSAQKAPKRTRSEPIISPRRESRSTSGPASSPTTTVGRMSAIRRARDPDRRMRALETSIWSATSASQVPRPEPSVARKSERNPELPAEEPGPAAGHMTTHGL